MLRTIDASGKRLGRVAGEAAIFLRGKQSVAFTRENLPQVEVRVIHASLLSISEEKKRTKEYLRYSGFPGGLKSASLGRIMEKRGIAEVLTKAVYGMLPANRLRKRIIKHLKISL